MDESRLTRVGVVVGTFEYMAPEIVTEGGGSPGADRYALGIVAYQMLTGRVPFTGESAHSIMYRQVHDPPPPPSRYRVDLTGPAEAALLRQLAKAPDERFPSAQAFVDALADVKRQADFGQDSLFDALMSGSSDVDEGAAFDGLPELPTHEWDKQTLLTFEREMLGLYVSDHPLFGVEHVIASAVDCPVSVVQDRDDGSNVIIGGIL